MELKISNNAKKDKQTRTAMSQQALVNLLLSEKQAVQPNNAQPQNNVVPVQEWGGK
jgi:hypothetical protein